MSAPRHTGPTLSAPRTLSELRREASAALRAALALGEASRAQVAAQLDCSASRLAQYVDDEQDATLDVARAAALPCVSRIALAEWIAGPGYRVVSVPDSSDAHDLAASATLMRGAAELAARHLEACADGHVCAREGGELVAAAEPLVRLALGVLELGRAAVREGVVGVSGRVVALRGRSA